MQPCDIADKKGLKTAEIRPCFLSLRSEDNATVVVRNKKETNCQRVGLGASKGVQVSGQQRVVVRELVMRALL